MIDTISEPTRILLVDDTPTNLTVLSESIQDQGWVTLFATDGETAIEQAEYAQPELILLDVMMPGLDGFETCKQLKSNRKTQDIPVIFMTALSDSLDKVKGLNLGAVDYITKPFQQEEVVARVKMQLRMHQLNRQLEANNELLEQRVKDRTQELSKVLDNLKKAQMHLVQSEKMSSLGQMMAGIAHEINNPVNFIYGNLNPASDYFKELIDIIKMYQAKYPTPDEELQAYLDDLDLPFIIEDAFKLLESLKIGSDRIRQIVLSMRNFSRLDEAHIKSVNVHEGIDSTLLILQHKLRTGANNKPVEIIKQYGNLPLIECYPSQLNQVFMNILSNAIDAFEDSDNSVNESVEDASKSQPFTIEITTNIAAADTVLIQIKDNGSGIPPQVLSKLFDPFFTTKPVGKGTGLGLSISHQIIVEKHGGEIDCVSQTGQGTCFTIKVPVAQPAAASKDPFQPMDTAEMA
ncbi:MAG: response regulator [Phormidesmis sp.]